MNFCNFCNKETKNKKYCSKSCSAKVSNSISIKRKRQEIECPSCNSLFIKSRKTKYCSMSCYKSSVYNRTENKIKENKASHQCIRSYLIKKRGSNCEKCGWGVVNKFSNKIPLVMNHIDGNSENNDLSNLEILCPCCDSLTSTYKSLNYGKGRFKRMERYRNNKSY